MVSVGDDSWDCVVCWEKSGIVLVFGKRGVCSLMEISGTSTYVRYIWLKLRSGGTNHGAGAGAAAAGRNN